MNRCTELKIGATEAGLLELRYRGIPCPDSWTYTPYSTTKVRGDGRSAGFGYPVASWSWDVLEQWQLDKLLDFLAAASDASVVVYISTYTDTGKRQKASSFTAIMHRPVDGEGKTMVPEVTNPVYNGVSVSFTRLESV